MRSFALLFLCVVFSACATTVPNIPLYADKGPLGARQEWMLGGTGRAVPKIEWDDLRFGMVCTPLPELSKILAVIEKLCYAGHCNYEEAKAAAAEIRHRLFVKRGRH